MTGNKPRRMGRCSCHPFSRTNIERWKHYCVMRNQTDPFVGKCQQNFVKQRISVEICRK
jgi:hypothetical protein